MDKNSNDICRSLKMADEINITPTKELYRQGYFRP